MAHKRILNNFIFGLSLVLFASCATTFNTKKVCVRIVPEKGVKVVTVENSVRKNDEEYVVKRQQENLKINVRVDSTDKVILIPPIKSFAYWENFLNLGVGFLVDKKTPRRFSYPKNIFLEKSDTTIKVLRFPTTKKGTVELCFLLPYINSFHVNTPTGSSYTAGFMGIGIGLNYYYKNNTYISINAGASANIDVPIPAPVDHFTEYQRVNCVFINVRNQHKLGRFDLGYGLSFSNSRWTLINSSKSNELSQQNKGLGLSLNLKHHLSKAMSIGVVYQPTFMNLNRKPAFGYQDFITIELAIKLRVKRPKENNVSAVQIKRNRLI